MPRPRILFAAEAVSLAHVSRPLALAGALGDAYDVHVACDPRYEALVRGVPNVTYWPMSSVPSEEFVRGVDAGGYIFEPDTIARQVEEEKEILRAVRPALAVSDMRFSLTVSAPAEGVPYASIVNAHWSQYRDLGFEEFSFAEPQTEARRSLVSRAAGRARRELGRLRPAPEAPLDPNTTNVNAARSHHGLSPFGSFVELTTAGDHVLYPEPEGFVGMRATPPHHHFVGAILWSPDVPAPTWWDDRDRSRPLVYVTLGSTGSTGGMPALVEALGELDATVVMSTAGRFTVTSPPRNVHLADFLPGDAMCAAADLVVCSGGSGTAYQALWHGVPVLGLWSNQDQYITVTTIDRHGAGRGVRAGTSSPTQLVAEVGRLLADAQVRDAARSLGRLFRSAPAPERFRAFVAGVVT